MSWTTTRSLVLVSTMLACGACLSPEEGARVPKSTLVIGIDVSGSFRQHYDDAIDFGAHYLYGHINGLGELRTPSAVFVGSIGGDQPGEAKSFQPIHAFRDKTVDEIAGFLRELYPPEDSFTDFNVFFDRVGTLIKRQGLILAPLEVVLLSDGVHDVRRTGATGDDAYRQIDVGPLEYLSRNVTVRLLYASPTVSVNWERRVPRKRVRMWTVDAPVMNGWQEQVDPNTSIDGRQGLWTWIGDNVDFRVRSRRL